MQVKYACKFVRLIYCSAQGNKFEVYKWQKRLPRKLFFLNSSQKSNIFVKSQPFAFNFMQLANTFYFFPHLITCVADIQHYLSGPIK